MAVLGDAFLSRTRKNKNSSIVTLKTLCSVHVLITEGDTKFTTYMSTLQSTFELESFEDKKNTSTIGFVKRYGAYIVDKIVETRTTGFDYCHEYVRCSFYPPFVHPPLSFPSLLPLPYLSILLTCFVINGSKYILYTITQASGQKNQNSWRRINGLQPHANVG